MISSRHYIELWVNGKMVELEDQDSLGIRLNAVLFNPTKVTTTKSEYSFSFDVPSTPNNDRIFNYANNLSRLNKFHGRYTAKVVADGDEIFNGSMIIEKYDASKKMYSCNLVNVKTNTLEDIFKEKKLTDYKWMIDYSGATTINAVNNDMSSKYYFPFLSYGVFQKDYVSSDQVGNTYTSKFLIDKYCKFYHSSFFPSINVSEEIRQLFEKEGYTVNGSLFTDPWLSNVYSSVNLNDEQVPMYNVGNPLFGKVDISFHWDNKSSVLSDGTTTSKIGNGGIVQDLSYPFYRVDGRMTDLSQFHGDTSIVYNFDKILLYGMLDSKNNKSVTVTSNTKSYMYDPNEMVIVIPTDGWYKITFECRNIKLDKSTTTFKAKQWNATYNSKDAFEKREMTITKDSFDTCPLEIQLVKNYDNNVELIKGDTNIVYETGNPNDKTYTIKGNGYTGSTQDNRYEWRTSFPHQELQGATSPTKTDNIVTTVISNQNSGFGNQSLGGGFNGGGSFGNGGFGNRPGVTSPSSSSSLSSKYKSLGYVPSDGMFPYDQAVSTAFICGYSSMGSECVSVMRRGYSWSRLSSVYNNIFATVSGMTLLYAESGQTKEKATEYQSNTYKNAGHTLTKTKSGNNGSFSVTCLTYLKRNDILEPMAIQRDYEGQRYAYSLDGRLTVQAITNRGEEALRNDKYFSASSPTEFPTQLNLFDFTNNETKASDWISNIQKAFNLEIKTEGNTVTIDVKKTPNSRIGYAVDIDDRINQYEAESEYISYPRSMSVKYKINKDEWGFEKTVSQDHINDADWYDYGDSGYTVIQLNDDTYETSSQDIQTDFSYTYYDIFKFKNVDVNGNEDTNEKLILLPVIELSQYMADGYGYDEAMKHDGYSLSQRFWFRQKPSTDGVYLHDNLHEFVKFSIPTNHLDDFNLSYKDSEKSILTEYFTCNPMLDSNYVNVDVYMSPSEYKDIKNGSFVHFDSDLYVVSEMEGYDPSGIDKVSLKLIKKT
jgi:hypothetical protein